MEVRKVVTRSSCHFRGLFPSLKNGRLIPFESILESGFLRLLEFSPQVLSYAVQPSFEKFFLNGKLTTYTPDVLVRLCNGSEVWCEVKPAVNFKKKTIRERMEAAAQHFSSTNRRFQTISDDVIAAEPRSSTLLTLVQHRRGKPLFPDFQPSDFALVRQANPSTVLELRNLVGPSAAMRMLGLGHIGIDLEEKFTPYSGIFLYGGHRHANLFS